MLFDVAEVYKMIGVLFANGLTPKPQLTSGSAHKRKSHCLAQT